MFEKQGGIDVALFDLKTAKPKLIDEGEYLWGKSAEKMTKDELMYMKYNLRNDWANLVRKKIRNPQDRATFENFVTSKWFAPSHLDVPGPLKRKRAYAEGGPVVPRIGYRDGSNWMDKLTDDDVYNLSRGWRSDMKIDPEVLERIKLREIQKQSEAHEEGFLSPLDYEPGGKMAHKEGWGIIPPYQADVFKKSFGTKEGLQYTGTKLGQGVVEGTEWLIDIIPHVMKELDERGFRPGIPDPKAYSKMKKYLKENKGKFNWMELLMPENLTWHKTGWFGDMDESSKKYMEQLKDKTGDKVPVGVRSVGTAAWLGGMFADTIFNFIVCFLKRCKRVRSLAN